MSTFLGVLGAGIVVLAFYLLQAEKIQSKSYEYNLLNLVGAILLTVSLIYHFNLGSLLIEVMWISVSIYGLIKVKREDDKKKN